ncbi:MAG: hypothetical protein GY953_52610 [bacterium]|nr:hypothetical protein [bacterium]
MNRTDLRANQSKYLKRARGRTILLVKSRSEGEDEKYVLDREYFDQIMRDFRAIMETLEITMDGPLFQQIMAAAETVDEDLRLGKLQSIDQVFSEE